MVQQLINSPDFENNEFPRRSQIQIKIHKTEFPFNTRPGSHATISLPDLEPFEEMERVIAEDVFMPIAFILNYMLPFPDRIMYNKTTRRFVFIRSTLFRKIVCVLCSALILWRLCVKISPNSETSKGVLSHIVKGSYVLFLFYCSVFFIQLWTSGQTFTSILNQGIDSCSDLVLKFHCSPRTRLVLLVTHASWVFCLTFSFTSHVMGGVIAIANEVTGNKNNSRLVMQLGYENVTDPRYALNELNPRYSAIVYAVIVVVANFLNTFNWMLSFLSVGIWAIVFRHLFVIFFSKMDFMIQYGYELDLPREIRTFNKLAALVDKYNALNGPLLLSGAIVAIMYISASIEQLVTGIKNISQFNLPIHLFLSYVPIISTALMMSELNRKANTISDVIKQYYNQWEGVTCSKTVEALYGISIVYHDVCMSNIGLKAFGGFFTATTQLNVTMFSLIITYSLVAIQWLPQVNPQASATVD